ncbi:type VI secretion system contractile sheath large subunit [Roseomonas sp. PWR1]|uniref:Type VI secretion system contractile sheath large subunit n=1 Tax=Roseomonas nitratireducens TaxID=2820810 RepID=A0ABS4ANE4_9PROT|nr:type VI secretion system contractile sheath large subunit [Neoroseomonas nitratireducens]MBP0462403.1 type VI secretion system contractile sheath large subunit [Neoroseomonas nitratireducens]
MPDTQDGADDPLAAILAATEDTQRAAAPLAAGAEAAALAKVETAIALLQSAIRNHPRFVALEAAWRSLHRLATAPHDGPLVVKLMPLTKREAVRDQRAVQDPEDSDLCTLLWHEGLGGGEPFGLLLADLEFGAEPDDILALRGLAAAGAGAFVPVVAHAAPALLDLPDWGALPAAGGLARIHEGPRHIPWRSLRESEEARFLALVAPRVLARGGEGAPRFTGGGWVVAARIAASFAREGWGAAIEGREDGTEPGLPPIGRVPTECDPADGQEVALATLGLTLLVPRGADSAVLRMAPTLHRPPRFQAAAANQDAALAARLPWVLAVGRILHGAALRARDELRAGRGVRAAEAALNAWLATLVGPEAPLAEARAELPAAQGQPGVHHLAIRLRPHLPQGTPSVAHKLVMALP